jgi:hypothetical protein
MWKLVLPDGTFVNVSDCKLLMVPEGTTDTKSFVQQHKDTVGISIQVIDDPQLAEFDGDLVVGSEMREMMEDISAPPSIPPYSYAHLEM